MKHLLVGAITGALLCTPALAQPQGGANNNFGAGGAAGGGQNNGGAVFQLPPSVKNVVSIDAYNMLIIQSEDERSGETRYAPSIIQHVYSGGIARLFGGTSVPTAQFVTPGQMNGGLGGGGIQGNNGGFGGGNNGGGFNNGGGGFNSGGGGFNNGGGGFGGGGFGGGFNNGGGGGFGGAFQNGLLGGNGFNTNNRNLSINAQVRAR